MIEEDAIDLESSEASDMGEDSPVEEKMLPVSRVNELVKKAKLKGRDQMQQQLEELQRENESLKQQPPLGGQGSPVDSEAIRKQVYEDLVAQLQQQQEAQAQEQLKQEAQKLATDYHSKMSSGKEQFDDFEEIVADFDPSAFPQIVYLANNTDNTAAVMYELAKNPQKLATLSVLSERDPRAAQAMINRLSSSIKVNEQAKAQEKSVNAPLNRMQSSPSGQDTKNVNDFDVKDFQKMSFLRG